MGRLVAKKALAPRAGRVSWVAHTTGGSRRDPAATGGQRPAGHGWEPTAAVDWPTTLRRKGPRALQRRHVQWRLGVVVPVAMHVIVLDISGSMAWGQRAARAKAYAAAIVEGARRSGAWVALLAVGGQHAQWVLRPRAARRSAVQRMQALGCGGGTPMQQAALQVEEVLCAHARHYPAAYRHVWVLTDGRVRTVPMRPLAAHEVTVVDFDDDPVPLGQARRWAAAWGARWLLAAAGCPGLAGGRDG